jgi:putative ABC transport system permease protein
MRASQGRSAEVAVFREASGLAVDSLVSQPLRAGLAILGVVIGIVTVVLIASILANVRNQIALLFRELGTDNVFAFHLTGDPYSPPSAAEANRKALDPNFARPIAELSDAILEVGVQVILPTAIDGVPFIARAGSIESDAVLVEAASANFLGVVGAEFARGRPFTEVEERSGARVAVVGASLATALFGSEDALGEQIALGGDRFTVVGVLAPRKGGFFGENRQDQVFTMPVSTARKRFGRPDRVVLYARAAPEARDRAFTEFEAILRQLRQLDADAPNDFNLSTSDQIIAVFDSVGATVAAATVGLASMSLLIGAIGIANVMLIGVTERTREIGLRLAIGARRGNVLAQFLIEAAILSGVGGLIGVFVALALGALLTLFLSGFSAVPPAWSMITAVGVSIFVGLVAGIVPARRAAGLDPAESLRHE